jgi:hypothetical protein
MAENGGQLNATKQQPIAFALNVDLAKLQAIVEVCLSSGLLYTEDGLLRSHRLDEHFNYRAKCAEGGRKGGKMSGRWADKSGGLQPPIRGGDSMPESINESKVKESKEKESKVNVYVAYQPPHADEVADYFETQGSTTAEAARYHDHFTANGWKVGGKAAMKDWKAAARNWIRNSKNFNNGKSSNTDKATERVINIAANVR